MDHERKVKFLTTELVEKILCQNADLQDYRLREGEDSCTLTTPQGLDGFMSVIHRLTLELQHKRTSSPKTLTLMVKVMKGDDDFRQKSLGLVLFPNEINVYSHVLPAFEQLVRESGAPIDLTTLCPRIYLAESGARYSGYSDQEETFLAMEDVASSGFVPGPRLNLDQPHLELMARKVAQLHACSYALRIGGQPDRLRSLVNRIIPLNFIQDGAIFFQSYDIVFKVVFERLFRYLHTNPASLAAVSDEVRDKIALLERKYGTNPSELMQRCLARDDVYSVILHGDYNRNNVLFRYVDGAPQDVMLLDFQENRYGSPALDLSFFMYMNMPPEAWADGGWEQVLTAYHRELVRCICAITHLQPDDSRLLPYGYEAMKRHLAQYFIYGAVIAIKFLPCMLSSEAEVQQIVHHFHTDITAPGFRDIYLIAGGEPVNERLTKVLIHATEHGYLDML
uniref:Putative juvenile hormone-inducible protein n=1 Tax=Anopheles triannulatus TaxID=58253 RepID=A0A2M4A6M4_9DIPT